MTLRVVFCWSSISGYMASCWRALSQHSEVDLLILAFANSAGPVNVPFAPGLVDDIPCILLNRCDRDDSDGIFRRVSEFQPDVIVLCGWFRRPYLDLVFRHELRNVRFVMGMDTPWSGSVRQRLAWLFLWRFLRRMDLVVVSGERSWQYARRLGVPQQKLRRGVYGVDYAGLATTYERRLAQPGGWPKRFLYVGRLASEKAIDILIQAYGRYRDRIDDPWPLMVCGTGPQEKLVANIEGVDYLGFVQPGDMKGIWEKSGTFVITSRFDPWPLVVVEACAAGLPVVCTEACGSAVELIRPYYNGIICPIGDAKAVGESFTWIHEQANRLPLMGDRSRHLASAYSAESWVDRWFVWLKSLTMDNS